MSKAPNSAFFARLQTDGFALVELIDLEARAGSWHWTTCNAPVTYTLSGVPTEYIPFPGGAGKGVEGNLELSVSVLDFMVANTGSLFDALLPAGEFDMATLKIGHVFPDTPDLGRMYMFEGKLGDMAWNRNAISGQVRSKWGDGRQRWPYYNYSDTCVWRFGSPGCGFDTSSVTLALGTTSLAVNSSTASIIRSASGTLTGSYTPGRFDFGRLTVTGGVNSGQVRTIRVHTGDLLTLSHPLAFSSLNNLAVSIFPGCRKRLIADCKSLYNNDENFMGFPWIPVQESAF